MNRSTSTATFTSMYVQALLDVGQSYGIAEETILEHAGLRAEDLLQPGATVTQPQLMVMYQAVILLSGVPSIGLEVGKQVRPGLFSLLGYALKSCSTLAEAMIVSQKYQPVIMGQGQVSMSEKGGEITMQWLPQSRSPQLLKPLNDSIMACWLYFGRLISGLNIYPSAVSFCHPEPSDISVYRQLFNCPISFASEANSMTIPRRLLATPLLESDPELKTLMLEEMEKLNEQQPALSVKDSAEKWLLQRLGKEKTGCLELSSHFHMSERTLRRALSKEGVQLRSLTQDAKRERASYLLAETDTPISEVASLLGYKSNSCFSQAFKRWTGQSPSMFRKAGF